MFGREKKGISMTAIFAALVLGAASASVASDAFALQQAATSNDGSGPVTIRIAEGKISGKFDHLPLFEVLDKIGGQAGFEYQGDGELLDQPVSGKFDGVPVIDAMKKILEPFNYIIVSKANGEIRFLHIVSFRGAPPAGVPAEVRVPRETRSPKPDFSNEPDTLTNFNSTTEERLSSLTEEERLGFEVADKKLGPPPEWLEYFELVPERGSAETGPRIRPDMAVQDLPEFEPFVSETGPSADRLENN